MSEELSQCYSGCKNVYINLGGNKSYEISERCLFKRRNPDINPKTDPNINKECPPSPTVKRNPHFIFILLLQAGYHF